jgi:hypothetical protein
MLSCEDHELIETWSVPDWSDDVGGDEAGDLLDGHLGVEQAEKPRGS